MFKGFALFLAVTVFGFCFYSLYAAKSPAFKAYSYEYELYLSSGSFGDNIARATSTTFGLYKNVKGESCKVHVPYRQILEDFSATHLFSESTEYGTSYYAYTPKLGYKVYLKGVAVNLHYFEGKEQNKLGTPMIYGSF